MLYSISENKIFIAPNNLKKERKTTCKDESKGIEAGLLLLNQIQIN